MAEERRVGDWLTGVLTPRGTTGYPGEEFGLPREGRGSVSPMSRRIVALCLDWLLAEIIAVAALHSQYWTFAIFAVEVYLLTALTGFTVGKRLMGLRVVRLDNKPVGLLWSLVRTLLLLTLIPPLVTDGDLRGLHDRASNTIVLRI